MSFRLLAITALALATSAFAQKEVQPEDFIGKPVPAFAMTDTAGKKLTNANLKGKVVVMDFWATWCTTCRRVSPIMETLHKKYGAQGLVVIGTDVAERKGGTAAKYKKQHGYTYRFTEGNDKFAYKLGIQPLPTVVIIDKKGIVRKVAGGFYNGFDAEMDKAISSLLAEK